jgi:hypothetical protein
MQHVKIHWTEDSYQTTKFYLVSDKTFTALEAWKSERKRATGKDLDLWLYVHGAKPDRHDGPAIVTEDRCGYRLEAWFRDGRLDRVNGPARVESYPSGTLVEDWFRAGKRDRSDGPAHIETRSDGTRFENWYRNGEVLNIGRPSTASFHSKTDSPRF